MVEINTLFLKLTLSFLNKRNSDEYFSKGMMKMHSHAHGEHENRNGLQTNFRQIHVTWFVEDCYSTIFIPFMSAIIPSTYRLWSLLYHQHTVYDCYYTIYIPFMTSIIPSTYCLWLLLHHLRTVYDNVAPMHDLQRVVHFQVMRFINQKA